MVEKMKMCHRPIHPTKPHLHEELSICLIESGNCTLEIYNKNYVIGEKTLLFIPAQAVHKCVPENLKNWKFRILFINKNLIKSISNSREILNRFNYKKLDKKTFEIIDSLFTKIEAGFQCENSTIKSLIKILCLAENQTANFIDSRYNIKENIENVKEYLNKFYFETPSLDEISKISNLSKYYIIREFEKIYGISPRKYIISKKIALAQELIDKKNGIADIAIQLGFYDQSHFSKFFKQYTGISPKKYLTDYI